MQTTGVDFVVTLFARGGPIMWPLLLGSVVSVTLALERIFFWWRERRNQDSDLADRLFALVEKGDCEAAVSLTGTPTCAFSRVMLAGLLNRNHGFDESMEVQAGREVERMKQGLSVLDTIITMAPLLGILGTVTGIIESFDLLGESGIEDPRAVTGGIAQALITTAAGLSVALITLVPFNYFVARAQRAAREIEQIATQFAVAYKEGVGLVPAADRGPAS